MLKSPISLKLGTNVRYQELAYVTECQVKILNSLGDPGSPCKNHHFARLCIINKLTLRCQCNKQKSHLELKCTER